jgi:hypothetical protein
MKLAPVGHTYNHCDRSFAHVGEQMKKRRVIGDPKEVLEVVNETKNSTAAPGWTMENLSTGKSTSDSFTMLAAGFCTTIKGGRR